MYASVVVAVVNRSVCHEDVCWDSDVLYLRISKAGGSQIRSQMVVYAA